MNFSFCGAEGSWPLCYLLTIVPFHHLSVMFLLVFLVVGRGTHGSIQLPVAVELRTGTEASSFDSRGQREQMCSIELFVKFVFINTCFWLIFVEDSSV